MTEFPEAATPTVSVVVTSAGPPHRTLIQREPTGTFHLGETLHGVVDEVAHLTPSKRPGLIECKVRWRPAALCLPEFEIDQHDVQVLAERGMRFDLHLVRAAIGDGPSPSNLVLPSIRVEFIVRGKGFDPAELTDAIGLGPDDISRSNPTRPKRLDTWTRGGLPVRSLDFAPLFAALLGELVPKTQEIRRFCREHGATATFAFVTEVVDAAPNLAVSSDQFTTIAAFGASLWFDPYCRKELE